MLDKTDQGYTEDRDGAVSFDVTENGRKDTVKYNVSYEKEGPHTIITNAEDSTVINVEKKWDIDLENKDKPGSIDVAVQQKKEGKWKTVTVTELNDDNDWKAGIRLDKDGDGDFRVRELREETALEELADKIKKGTAGSYEQIISQIKESSYYDSLPDNIKQAADSSKDKLKESLEAREDDLFDKLFELLDIASANDRLVYDKDDDDKGDGTANEVVYSVDEYVSVVSGGTEEAHKTRYRVSYKNNGNSYTITNKAIVEIDVIKRWLALGVDEDDMPDSAWVVLMCKPKAGALDNAKNLPGVDSISGVLDYEFPVMNPIEGGIDPLDLFSRLAIGINISGITKAIKSVASIFGIEWIIPEFAIGKVDEDCNWTYKVVDSKYTAGIPMEYKGAELSSELIRQIIDYITHGLIPDMAPSFNPFDGYLSIPTRAIRTILKIENWSDIIDGTAWDNLKEKGKNLTWDDIKNFGPKSLLDDDHMMANVINVKIDIDIDDDDPDDPNDPNSDNVTIYGKKVWEDGNDTYGYRPDTLKVYLMANGTRVKDEEGNDVYAVTSKTGSWNFFFPNMPINDSEGKKINYSVSEEAVRYYKADVTKDENNDYKFIITNTCTPPRVDIKVTKKWNDDENRDGIRPETVTVKLLMDGEILGNPLVLSEENNWQGSFNDMLKYDKGREIHYTVEEQETDVLTGRDAEGTYRSEVSGNVSDGFTITNTHTPETITVSGSKTWDDDDDRDGIRPDHIMIRLLADGSEVDKRTVTAADGWKWDFTNLPKNNKGEEIKYTISEDRVSGYKPEINGYDVTNTHNPELIRFDVHKTWEDNSNEEKQRPDKITINLLADGVKIDSKTVTVTKQRNSSVYKDFYDLYAYRDHGVKIKYTVTEEPVANYTASVGGHFITNTYNPDKTQVTVHKVWDDADDQDGIRPRSVTVKLLKNGEDSGKTITLSESNNWSGIFSDLNQTDRGTPIKYSIAEVKTDVITGKDDAGTYSSKVSGDAENGYTITNKHTPETTDITVEKEWDDNNNQDGARPGSVTVRLRADGQEVASAEVNEGLFGFGGWKHTFEDLPVYKNGEKINYSISEDAVADYTSSVSGDADKDFTITNKHNPEKIKFDVFQVWLDDNNRDGKRPKMQIVHLIADGKDTGRSITLTESGGWEGSFGELDKYKEGKRISYSVTSDEVQDYEFTMMGDVENNFVLFNSHVPARKTVNVNKKWDDSNDQDGKRPESITVRLRADGLEAAVREVTGENGEWRCSFEDVYVYEDGREIRYTVSEDVVDDYTTTITKDEDDDNLFTITNKHNPKKTQVAVYKAWDDMGDREGFRPASVKVQLLKDGKPVSTDNPVVIDGTERTDVEPLTLNDENDWNGTFDNLDKYENQGDTIIYGVEEVKEGVITGADDDETYTPIVSGDPITGYTITNVHTPKLLDIPVSIEWDDDGDRDGVRPDIVALRMLANGQQNAMTFMTKEDGWEDQVFVKMLRYEEAKRNNWTMSVTDMEDNPIAGYKVTVTGSETEGFHAVLKHVPAKTSVSVNKVWDDADNKDGIRPDSITVRLLANDEATDKTIELSENNDWAADFTDLYKNEAGKAVKYAIEEVKTDIVTGKDDDGTYTSDITGNMEEGFTITNTHTPWYEVTYKMNGGEYKGSGEDIAERYRAGTEISIHEAPTREGYEFLYWKGSEYQPGDKYTVTEDHVFTAQWKKTSDPEEPDNPAVTPPDSPDGPDKPDNPGTPDVNNPPSNPPTGHTPRTGDDNTMGLWIAMLIMAALGFAGAVSVRRRNG